MNICTRVPRCILELNKTFLLDDFDYLVIPTTHYSKGDTCSVAEQFHSILNGRQYRGTHLIPLRLIKTRDLTTIESHIKAMVTAYPYATAWDVIHENWCLPWRYDKEYLPFIKRCIDLCRHYSPSAKLFLSEFRPQNTKRWVWAFSLLDTLQTHGYKLDGISVQLHCNLLNLTTRQTEWIKHFLLNYNADGYDIHCYEVMVFNLLSHRVKYCPPPPLADSLQRQQYIRYKSFATSVNASLFGLWHPWDGSTESYWYDHETNPGIIRANNTQKPAYSVFI